VSVFLVPERANSVPHPSSVALNAIYLNLIIDPLNLQVSADGGYSVSASADPSGNLSTPKPVGVIGASYMHFDTDVITVKIISGPGTLGKSSLSYKRILNIGKGETLTVYSDGSAGKTTIQGYIDEVPISQSAKTFYFFGKVSAITATANSVTANSLNLTAGSDSVTSGNAILTFTARDINGIAVSTASQSTGGAFYLHFSDTKIIQSRTSPQEGFSTCSPPSNLSDWASGKWVCDVNVVDSGVVTLKVSDTRTLDSTSVTSNEIVVSVAGPPYFGTVTFSKLNQVDESSTFYVGEVVEMNITCKDFTGRICGQPTMTKVSHNPFVFPASHQNRQFVFVQSESLSGTLTFATIQTAMEKRYPFDAGTLKLFVTMPLTIGDLEIYILTKCQTSDSCEGAIRRTLVVTEDPRSSLATTASAAQAAADAATDAALEAIDAANAATDAANLAAEAADAATVAAEEARDAADAATAAVEALSTEVATMMAALKAQITTLAKTVAKIAKKVKA
jgi:hypothetical protein